MFAERHIEPEELDHSPPEVARRNLADLVRINRYFGGHSTIRRLLHQANVPAGDFSLLDVGAASGDTGGVIQQAYPRARVFNLDLHPVNLSAAAHPKVVGDAFRLPFATGGLDFVLSSLFLHHFTCDQVVCLLREFNRVARCAVLIADLERSVWPYLFLSYSGFLFRWGRVTVSDGKISVRAAFRKRELQDLADKAGIVNARVESHRPAFRLTLVAKKLT